MKYVSDVKRWYKVQFQTFDIILTKWFPLMSYVWLGTVYVSWNKHSVVRNVHFSVNKLYPFTKQYYVTTYVIITRSSTE